MQTDSLFCDSDSVHSHAENLLQCLIQSIDNHASKLHSGYEKQKGPVNFTQACFPVVYSIKINLLNGKPQFVNVYNRVSSKCLYSFYLRFRNLITSHPQRSLNIAYDVMFNYVCKRVCMHI